MVKSKYQKKFNIKKGDQVVVISGADKNATTPREVLAVIKEKDRVLVKDVNIRTKHQKPDAKHPEGGILKIEAPIHISNVMMWDAKAGKGTRVSRLKEGKNIKRISKKSGTEL